MDTAAVEETPMTRFSATRRQFFGLAAGGTAAAALTAPYHAQAQTQTSAHIVIIGAGGGGTALANRLVRRLDGAQITLIDPRAQHLYQPGLTLVATGLKPANYVTSKTTDWLPDGVTLIAEKGSITLGKIATLGHEREIKQHRSGNDAVRIRFTTKAQVQKKAVRDLVSRFVTD